MPIELLLEKLSQIGDSNATAEIPNRNPKNLVSVYRWHQHDHACPMEGIFATWNFVQSVESIVGMVVGRLSLSKGEGEGEGSSRRSLQRSNLNPSPQSSPLDRGEAGRARKRPPVLHYKFSLRVA